MRWFWFRGASEEQSLTHSTIVQGRLLILSTPRPVASARERQNEANGTLNRCPAEHRNLRARRRATNYRSNLNATVASGGKWIRIECSRAIQATFSLCAPP
jgi:hypothetical protein